MFLLLIHRRAATQTVEPAEGDGSGEPEGGLGGARIKENSAQWHILDTHHMLGRGNSKVTVVPVPKELLGE